MKPLNQLLPGEPCGDLEISGITSNSDQVKPGNLYFAIPGTKHDGHDFITQAVKNGASAVVGQYPAPAGRLSVPYIKVASSRKTLAEAAAIWFGDPTAKMNLVGITGTNGKTTTTYLLRQLWQHLKIPSGLIGTIEYWIGKRREKSSLTTPDAMTLQRLFSEMVAENIRYAAMEVSSIALDQYRAHGTRFKVGVFTNLTQDHLDYHRDMESYFQSKVRLFTDFGLETAVINIDDPYGVKLVEMGLKVKCLTFSLKDPKADFSAEDIRMEKGGTLAKIKTPAGKKIFHTPLIGKHNLANCFTALATAHALGQSIDDAIEGLGKAAGAPGRLERVKVPPRGPHVFVDYAHTPDALSNVIGALNALRQNQPGRLITVFGCGGDRDRSKRPLMAGIASRGSDLTIATSDNPRTESPETILDDVEVGIAKSSTEYYRETNRRSAIHMALKLSKPDDIVLVAGKGHETYQIVGKEELPFDDREVVHEYYK